MKGWRRRRRRQRPDLIMRRTSTAETPPAAITINEQDERSKIVVQHGETGVAGAVSSAARCCSFLLHRPNETKKMLETLAIFA